MGKENKQMSKLTLVALILMIFTSISSIAYLRD